MGKGFVERWFLGANSGAGFYSLYENFAADEGDFLWVIKAGPGCGKSEFMKRIGLSAEQAGLNVEYIQCSADPDSLDGVYLPDFKTGWVDGTSPHTLDPRYFGATGAYTDLGIFCDIAAVRAKGDELRALTQRYRDHYTRAYAALAAAATISPSSCTLGLADEAEIQNALRRAASVAARELPKKKKDTRPGKARYRLISNYCPGGKVFISNTFSLLCNRIYELDNQYGLASPFIRHLCDEALERGLDVIVCPSPLFPKEMEALLIPSLSLGFLAVKKGDEHDFTPYRHVRLDALIDPVKVRAARPRLRADAKIEADLLRSAQNALGAAKAVHDEIEALFRPHVDFAGIHSAADRSFWMVMDT